MEEQASSQVWALIAQWPILGLFLFGFGLAWWLWGRNKDTGLNATITTGFANLGEKVDEIKTDMALHVKQDRENFQIVFGDLKKHGEALAHIEGNMERRAGTRR